MDRKPFAGPVDRPVIRTTEAAIRRLDPEEPASPAPAPAPPAPRRGRPPCPPKTLPPYPDGCPRCGAVASLATEQRGEGRRVCRCRQCGWRGLMEG